MASLVKKKNTIHVYRIYSNALEKKVLDAKSVLNEEYRKIMMRW